MSVLTYLAGVAIIILIVANYYFGPKNNQSPKTDDSLINKYNINDDHAASSQNSNANSTDWINDRKARESHMHKQRQQMVLNARRRTLELMNQQAKSSI